jgi:flavin-dependent dehydrogenase
MTSRKSVVVIGAGPAGIAAAIAASQIGFRCVVLDQRQPPIDKPCGEGILPHGVAALRKLGIHLDASNALPFVGIRFQDEESSARAEFPCGAGFALRRPRLHQLLVDRAIEVGVDIHWGASVTQVDTGSLATGEKQFPYDWLIGADGHNSVVREWAGLRSRVVRGKRFGFRRHFQVRPWTDVVEVYWASGCQMFVTPTGAEEVGVAVFSREPQLRVDQALERFPVLVEKLQGAAATSKETGDTTSLRILPEVTQGCIALTGDASGTVDAVTGYGLSLAFQQAVALGDALDREDLSLYQMSHRMIATIPVSMTRLMQLMEGSDSIRRKALRLFQATPSLFSRLLSIHSGNLPMSSVHVGDIVEFGWKLLRA